MGRQCLIADGISDQPQIDFQTFPAKIREPGDSHQITVPVQIIRQLKLTSSSILQIAIREISEEECKKLFLSLPKTYKKLPIVTCPICNQKGRLHILRDFKKTYYYVRHRQNKKNTQHSLKKKDYPAFFSSIFGEVPE